MHAMTKTTFIVKTDVNGLPYVVQEIDELTKNHRQNDREATSGFMPEIPGSSRCPMSSFLSYLEKLNPSNDKLWQKPKDSFCTEERIWFCNIAVWKNENDRDGDIFEILIRHLNKC